MLDLQQFEKLFNEDWWKKLKPWFETEEAFNVYQILKTRSRNGAKIFPEHERTFRAFKITTPKNIKAVIVGLSPYHTIDKETQRPHADGLAFSTSLTRKETPSLELFYDAIQKDLGNGITREPDLSYLAEQGVLLLNYSLTSELGKPTIHADTGLWSNFNRFLYGEVLRSECGVPFLLCGKQAHSLEKYLFKMCHMIKKVEHPAAAARDNRAWNHQGAFKWIDEVIADNNGKFFGIEWDSETYNDIPWT